MACGLLSALIPQGLKLPELGNSPPQTPRTRGARGGGNREEKTLAVFFLTVRGDDYKNRAIFLETETALFLFKLI